MEQIPQALLTQLLTTAKMLSTERLIEAVDFVEYLRQRTSEARKSERGSATALLRHAGAFRFGVNELEQLLTDLAQMRLLDLESHA